MTHACFLKTSRTLIACNVFCLSPVIESGVSITIAMTNLYGVLSVQLNFLQCLHADASELQEGRIPTPQCINHQHIEIMLIKSCGDGVVNATHNVRCVAQVHNGERSYMTCGKTKMSEGIPYQCPIQLNDLIRIQVCIWNH